MDQSKVRVRRERADRFGDSNWRVLDENSPDSDGNGSVRIARHHCRR